MRVLRWLVFLPVGAVLVAVAQIVTVGFAEAVTWWISAPTILFFGVLIGYCGLLPVWVAPHRLVGASILVTLFVLLEGLALFSILPGMDTYPAIVRLYTDVAVVCGALMGAKGADGEGSVE